MRILGCNPHEGTVTLQDQNLETFITIICNDSFASDTCYHKLNTFI